MLFDWPVADLPATSVSVTRSLPLKAQCRSEVNVRAFDQMQAHCVTRHPTVLAVTHQSSAPPTPTQSNTGTPTNSHHQGHPYCWDVGHTRVVRQVFPDSQGSRLTRQVSPDSHLVQHVRMLTCRGTRAGCAWMGSGCEGHHPAHPQPLNPSIPDSEPVCVALLAPTGASDGQ